MTWNNLCDFLLKSLILIELLNIMKIQIDIEDSVLGIINKVEYDNNANMDNGIVVENFPFQYLNSYPS